jgi:hypothetical protein
MKIKSFLLAGICLLVCIFAEAATTPDAQKTATAFYNVYIRTHPPGVPDAAVRKQFQPVVSPTLNDLLAGAAKAEADYAKQMKGEAPPLVEGDLFTSNFEGATSFSILSCDGDDKFAICAVDLVYVDDVPRQPPVQPTTIKWTDKAFLIRTNDGWKVDDIAYGGNWPFGNHGRLKDALSDVQKAAKE